mgnify:CR=1 FL=1
MVGLFLLSAAGCLAPIAMVLIGVLIKNKVFMGIEYNRLPVTLKAGLISSLGIGSLLLLIMVFMVTFD